jgi:low temperature requirement protein LtrA
VIDVGAPLLFWAEGWQLMPAHFAERFGLIVIIALGESIVAIGLGSHEVVDLGVVTAAILGVGIAAALWWLYFDVIAWLAVRRLVEAEPGREQNELARDAYGVLHYPIVAGIVLAALGLKTTLADVNDPLDAVPAAALVGGVALYLLGHVAVRWRIVHTLARHRLVCALVLVALFPLALEIPALATVALVMVVVSGLVVYEVRRFAETRDRVRHRLAGGRVAE